MEKQNQKNNTTGRSVCFSFRLTMATLFVGFIYKVCYFPYA